MKKSKKIVLVARARRGHRAPKANRPKAQDAVTRYCADDLARLVPGTTRRTWLREYIPYLLSVGALNRVGKAWFGKRSEIEDGLLGKAIRR